MAFLLLLHQKMSLQRKVNKLTLAQTSIGTRKERISKRIEKVQKAYAKKQSKLDAQAKLMTSQSNNWISQQMMAMQNQYQTTTAMQALLGNNTEYANLYKTMEEAYKKGEDSQAYKDAKVAWENAQKSEAFKNAYQQAQLQATEYNNQISVQRQMQQQMMNAYSTNFNDQVSIWLEAEKQKLEDQEQLALAPLEDEDTQIDLEQASNEAQLSYAQSRLDAIKQALDSRAQEAPKFGA